MRLLHLYIDGFGRTRDLTLEDLPHGLVILSGDNEAGKTTCLSFIRDVLFGFRDGRSAENNYLPADGGRYGGRLVLVSERLGELSIERRPGKKGGPVSISFADGRRGGEEVLPQILGATTRDLFRNVYAFSLSELQTIETLKSEAVKGVLYGAALGASTLNLPSALASIDALMGDLFKPGGRNPQINRKLADLEQKRILLREARKDIDRYDQASLEMLDVERRIEELRVAIAARRQKKERTTSLIRLWEDWLVLADLERTLEDIPEDVDTFPEDGLRRLEGLAEKIERTEDLLRDLRIERDLDKGEVESLFVNEAMMTQSSVIQELLSRRETYLTDCSTLVAGNQGLETVSAEIEAFLGDLGAGWTVGRVLSVDRSLFTRETILRRQKDLEERASKRSNRANLVGLKQADFEAAVRDEEEARKILEGCEKVVMEADEMTLQSLQNGRDQFASVIRDLPQVKQQIKEEREKLMLSIREISPTWDESLVRCFDCSIGVRQKVQRIEDEMKKVESEAERTADAIGRTRKELDSEERRLREAAAMLGRLGTQPNATQAAMEGRRSSLRLLRTMLTQKEKLEWQAGYEESRLDELCRRRDEYIQQAEAATPANLTAACLALAAAAAVAFLLLLFPLRHDIPLFAGTALLLAAVGLCWLHAHLRRSSHSRAVEWDEKKRNTESAAAAAQDGLRRSREGLEDLTRRIREATASQSIQGTIGAEDIDRLESEAEREVERIREWEALEGQVGEARARSETLQRDLENLQERDRRLKAALETERDEWADYLKTSGLSADLAPRTGGLIFLKVENLRGEIDRLCDLQGRLDKMEETRRGYYESAGRAPALGRAVAQDDPASLLSAVDSFLKQAREDEARQRRTDAAVEALEERSRRRKNTAKDLEAATGVLEDARREEAEGLESWGDWLDGHGLSREISPSIALEAFAKISDCVGKIGEKERLKEKIAQIGAAKQAYHLLGQSLFVALGQIAPPDEKLPAAIDRIAEEHDLSKTNRTVREGLERKIGSLSAKIGEQEKVLMRYRGELSSLLASADAIAEDEFRRRGRLFEEKKEIKAGIAYTGASLRKISGEEDLSLLRRELEGVSLEALRVSEVEHQEGLQDLEHERDALRQKKAELNQIMTRLVSADDISRLRAEEESLVEEIRALARDWGRHAMAKALLAEARRRYEQEQQPKVINDAGRFFREMTGGRYEKLVAPIGGETIEVVTDTGEIKRPEILSRGTAEQLYLAIRFAYITNYSAHSESLPVIMDDVLVNFDPKRTDQAIRAILTLAETHQILYFTCHPETVDRCRKYREETRVINLHAAGSRD